jgi:tryptophan synthase alpha chain
MKNRLLLKASQAQKAKSKLFCAFLTLGYPNLAATEKLIVEFEKAGVDIIELGFPFSDPMADGPTIQYSSERALENGVKMEDAFKLVAKLRKKGCRIPILLFTYLNPVFHYGEKRIVARAAQAGFDGFIIPDAPPEEEQELTKACHNAGLARVYLVAPTTEKKRAAMIARHSEGFIYYVSLRGVTGARKALPSDIQKNLKGLKRVAQIPVLIGFGVSSPEQSRKLGHISQGVIVGSAIVEQLRKSGGKTAPAVAFVRRMVKALKA